MPPVGLNVRGVNYSLLVCSFIWLLMMTDTGCKCKLLIGLGVQVNNFDVNMPSVQCSRNLWQQSHLLPYPVNLIRLTSLLHLQSVEVVVPDSWHHGIHTCVKRVYTSAIFDLNATQDRECPFWDS